MSDDVLAGWERGSFTAAGYTRDTYRRGEGPAVIVVHEIPGITPAVARFADEVVERGFTVVMPDLVGTPGKDVSPAVPAEFDGEDVRRQGVHQLGARQDVTDHRLAPCAGGRTARRGRRPGRRCLRMCFTGGFALGMMVDEVMVAPVLSQPSLPFPRGKGDAAGNLGLSPEDEAVVIERAAAGCQVLGLRYTGDKVVGGRFDTLREKLGDSFIAIELPSTSPRDHSVLTEQRDDDSVEQVLDFFVEKLL